MRPMASPDRVAAVLEPFVRRPERAAVVTDFDGTLAPIVTDPAAARPLAVVPDLLRRLAARFARVAVVSGRPAAFLLDHLGAGGVSLHGIYGLEAFDRDGRVVANADAASWEPVVADVAERTRLRAPAGVTVEPKGLSLTLHFRGSPSADNEARAWVEAEAARTGLVVHAGRRSYELRPPVPLDKGTVVEGLGAGLDAVCFAGDDVGDLAAFDALDRLARRGACALRVGVRSAEAPDELLERADIVVEGPEGAVALLERLVV